MRYCIYIPEDDYLKWEAQSRFENRTISSMIRYAVNQYCVSALPTVNEISKSFRPFVPNAKYSPLHEANE